jgi:hypothetical protein
MSTTPAPAPAPTQPPKTGFPYEANHIFAGLLLAAGLLTILITGIGPRVIGTKLPYTGGDAAATVGVLFALALIMEAPALIMDDSPSAGGEPSTMRILTLSIVFTFCALMLKTGWDTQTLPSLKDQGNWVLLVTAAIGGKAAQKYLEDNQQKPQ